MISCSINNCFSVTYRLSVDASHNFSLTCIKDNAPTIGQEISIYKDGVLAFVGIATKISTDSNNICSVSGVDKSSYIFDNLEVNEDYSLETSTTLANLCAIIDSRITCSVSQTCYGFGTYAGTVTAFVGRICNSFGLHFFYNPTSVGVTIVGTVIQPSSSPTSVDAMTATTGEDYSKNIGKIRLQKSVSNANATKTVVKNGALTWKVSDSIKNSVPANSASTYPRDVYIDPGTMEQVTLYSNSTFTEYTEPVSISASARVRIDSWADDTSSPHWQLYLQDSNGNILTHWAGTGDLHAWEDDAPTAVSAFIARPDPDNPGTLDYPDFDGCTCNITTWATPESSLTPWQGTFSSGDGGRTDSNVIDEPMYPSKSLIDGTRVAKRDSNPYDSSLTLPGHQDLSVYRTYSNGDFEAPAVDITWASSSADTTVINGEW